MQVWCRPKVWLRSCGQVTERTHSTSIFFSPFLSLPLYFSLSLYLPLYMFVCEINCLCVCGEAISVNGFFSVRMCDFCLWYLVFDSTFVHIFIAFPFRVHFFHFLFFFTVFYLFFFFCFSTLLDNATYEQSISTHRLWRQSAPKTYRQLDRQSYGEYLQWYIDMCLYAGRGCMGNGKRRRGQQFSISFSTASI